MIAIHPVDTRFDRWEDLLSLIHTSFRYMDGIIDPPSSAKRLTLGTLKEKAASEFAFVAMKEGTLVGCVFCRPEQMGCLYIGKLAVMPEMQGQGIGRQLLEVAQAFAHEKGCERLRLETRIELTKNHVAFARCGFLIAAEKAHPGYDRVTFVEMIKVLERPGD